MELRPLLPRVDEHRTDLAGHEERAMVAIRSGVRRVCREALAWQVDLQTVLQANFYTQPIVDTSGLLPNNQYEVIRVFRVELADDSISAGFKVLMQDNSRELFDRYLRWPRPVGNPRMFADAFGQIDLIPVPTVNLNATVHVAISPTGESYESMPYLVNEAEEAITTWAIAEMLVLPGRFRDPALAKDYRRRHEDALTTLRNEMELGTSGRYVIKTEPGRRMFPGFWGGMPWGF